MADLATHSARTHPHRPAESPQRDIFATVTERILEQLEKGVVPWQSPSLARVGWPVNFATKRPYQGVNVFLLASREFQSPFFLTYLQAAELGGHVRRGEHGEAIVKAGTYQKADEPELPSDSKDADKSPGRRFLKFYTVFNACQIDGIEFPPPPRCESYTESEMAERARVIAAGMPNPPKIHEGRKATPHYLPDLDTIEMPSKETFRAEWRYWKTLYHELSHSTGIESRLNRKSLTELRGSTAAASEREKLYCLEELVAEMSAAFLAAHAGILEDDCANSAAYLKGWADALKDGDNKSWIIRAASDAQKAANYILGQSAT